LQEDPNWRVPFEGTWTEEPIEDGWKQAWFAHSEMPAKVLFPVYWGFRPDKEGQALVMHDNKLICFSASGDGTFKDISKDEQHPIVALQVGSACNVVRWGSQSGGRDLHISRSFESRDEQNLFIRLLVDAFPQTNIRRGAPGFPVNIKLTVAFMPDFISETETGAFIR
jgi:hypothetical protein